jgi:hypothetical protein
MGKEKEMKETARLISVVVIALVLMTAFSAVALASRNVPSTPETVTLTITTEVVCDRKVIESEQLNWECSSKDILDNPPLASGEKYGKIKYSENMIGSGGDTEFNKDFKIDTGETPNVMVTKSIGYTAGEKGLLSHAENVDMSLISKTSCVYVAAESSMSVTEVQATTETKVGITGDPVKSGYKINAEGNGLVSAGVNALVEDNYKGKMMYKDKSMAYGELKFDKEVQYMSESPFTTTTEIACDRKVVESEELEYSKKTRQIKYSGNMIASGGDTEFENDFTVDTVKTPNVVVTKSIGYTAGESGSLSHAENVDMSLGCAYVAAGSSMSMTEVQAATETKAQMTRTPKLHYEIYAGGVEGPGTAAEGTISAGMSAFVEDERKGLKLGYKTTVDGSFEFYKEMDFKP